MPWKIRLSLAAVAALSVSLTSVHSALAYHRPPITVRILNADGTEQSKFDIASANDATGMSVAVADLGTDGVPEIILGSGLGNEPRVHVVRQDGSEIGSFLAYAADMGVGINVAACDLDGNGTMEIVTAPQRGGGPHVRVFSAKGGSASGGDYAPEVIHDGFFAYSENFKGGVNLACGDLDGDGSAELVTLPGPGGGPHVRVWKKTADGMSLHEEFFAFGADDRRGLVGTVHDNKLTVVSQHASETNLKTYTVHSEPAVIDERAFTLNATGVGSVFAQGGTLKLTTTSRASVYDVTTGSVTPLTSPFGSAVAAAADVNQDGSGEIITVPAKPVFGGEAAGKSIVVDLSEQRLYAYKDGVLENTFLVSTGKYPFATPLGKHSVLAKPFYVDYSWSYGPGDPRNYNLGIVPYNLRIYPHIYIHYAYWHNNFGHPMSHGCINVNLENSKWIYEWADLNIPVTVQT